MSRNLRLSCLQPRLSYVSDNRAMDELELELDEVSIWQKGIISSLYIPASRRGTTLRSSQKPSWLVFSQGPPRNFLGCRCATIKSTDERLHGSVRIGFWKARWDTCGTQRSRRSLTPGIQIPGTPFLQRNGNASRVQASIKRKPCCVAPAPR